MTQTSALTVAAPSPPPYLQPHIAALADMAVSSLPSPSSRRNYSAAIRRYLALGTPLAREHILAHMASLRAGNLSASTINVALAAIRLLASEAHLRGLLSDSDKYAIDRIRGEKCIGSRTGYWLTAAQASQILAAAALTRHPVRNTAILACMLGCALRRDEVSRLRWAEWRETGGRWVFADIKGKGGRVRTVPCPAWAAEAVNAWRGCGGRETASQEGAASAKPGDETADETADETTGRSGRIFDLCPSAIWLLVRTVSSRAGLEVAPHDLRRTAARLMREGGAPLEQIKEVLGHSDLKTTARYLGLQLELRPGKAATDYVRLTLPPRAAAP